MPSDLDLLIDYYQWEIMRVKESIKENLNLHHYREVEFDERALGRMQRELDRLLELRNPLYPKIKRAEDEIDMYKRIRDSRELTLGKVFFESLYKPKIEERKRQISSLKGEPLKPSKEETQNIDEATFQLIEKKSKAFFIHFNESKDATLKVYIKKGLEFVIEFSLKDDDLSWYREYSILRDFNFELDEEEKVLFSTFSLTNRANILPLKETLAGIVIGLKNPLRMGENLFLEII